MFGVGVDVAAVLQYQMLCHALKKKRGMVAALREWRSNDSSVAIIRKHHFVWTRRIKDIITFASERLTRYLTFPIIDCPSY
jgi:hypothetical protein